MKDNDPKMMYVEYYRRMYKETGDESYKEALDRLLKD